MVLLASGLIWVIVALGVVATSLLGLALLMIVVLKRSSEQAADETLAPLRQKVSELMELCDQLKIRLDRASGASDPSVPEPTGRTGERVADAQAKLDEITDVWLKLQKMLETARDHGEAGQNVSGAQFREAAEMIDADEIDKRFEQAKAASGELETMLSELEGAPIQAVEATEDARDGLAALQEVGSESGDQIALRERLEALPKKPWTDPISVAEEAHAIRQRVVALEEKAGLRTARVTREQVAAAGKLDAPLPAAGGEAAKASATSGRRPRVSE